MDCSVHEVVTQGQRFYPFFPSQVFEFSFFTDVEELEDGACLQFTVWDKDRLSADDFIGETLCELKGKSFVNFDVFWAHFFSFRFCVFSLEKSKFFLSYDYE